VNPISYLETGVLHCDDNLAALGRFPTECIDLVYLDPPFFSNRSYEVIWGDEAEVRSFEDRWEGGINVYLDWMEARLRHLHRLLRPSGSLYLHCDPTASHYLKVMADGIFGRENFRNEVVWKRYGAHNDSKAYGRVHDVLLFYGKSREIYFDKQHQPYGQEYIEKRFRYTDPDGRRWREQNLASPNPRPNLTYPFTAKNGQTYSPPRNGWKYSQERMRELDQQDRLGYPTRAGGRLRLKNYLNEMPGVPVQDVWTDITSLGATSPERIGYPTQKPLALLERVIRSSCPPKGTVLDPFCGCGTTVAAAHELQREWIGIDISPQAVEIIKNRLNKLGAAPTVYGLPHTLAELRQMAPRDFQRWVIERVNGHQQTRLSGDMGIDGFEFFERLPIQIKQSERVGRNVVDNFETAVERAGRHKGYIVAFSFTRGAVEEVARVRRERELEIVLVKAEDVLRVGELIDAAVREGRAPMIQGETPDLLGLFRELQEGRAKSGRRRGNRKTMQPERQGRLPLN
jgi:DNA modification methylase